MFLALVLSLPAVGNTHEVPASVKTSVSSISPFLNCRQKVGQSVFAHKVTSILCQSPPPHTRTPPTPFHTRRFKFKYSSEEEQWRMQCVPAWLPTTAESAYKLFMFFLRQAIHKINGWYSLLTTNQHIQVQPWTVYQLCTFHGGL